MEDNCEYIQITDYIISDNIPLSNLHLHYIVYIYTNSCRWTEDRDL